MQWAFMKFSRPEYWRGLPFPSPGDLPNPGIEPRSPTLQVDSLPAEPPGKPREGVLVVKDLPARAGDIKDLGLIPGSGRSPGSGGRSPGGGHGNPLQCFCLENSMLRGAWWATVHGVTNSRTWLSTLADTGRLEFAASVHREHGSTLHSPPHFLGVQAPAAGMSPVPAYDPCHLPHLSQLHNHQTHGRRYRVFEQTLMHSIS